MRKEIESAMDEVRIMEKWEIQYDRWKLDTPDNHVKTFCYCEYCGKEIYIGEECFQIDDIYIHEDCFDRYVYETLNPIRVIAGK